MNPPSPLPQDVIEEDNRDRRAGLDDDYASLGRTLDRRGRSIDQVKEHG